MSADLRERLRRLGVHKGAAHLKLARPAQLPDAEFEAVHTPLGLAFVRRTVYPLDAPHGAHPLGAVCQVAPLAPTLLGVSAEDAIPLADAVFLDTETTGLGSGAGAFAFLVGFAYLEGEQLVLEQFFLRDPAEEAAMLCAIDRRLGGRRYLATFNGRTFDVPLLESRFTLARLDPPFHRLVHLDLLLPARRVWRDRFGSCSLGALEYHLLGVQRTQQDVAGSIIPHLYREYLFGGGGALNDDMRRVLYHNAQDVLSLVTLAARIGEALMRPSDGAAHLAVGQRLAQHGHAERAEQHYRQALTHADHPRLRAQALRQLARHLKQHNRHDEAFEHWRQLAELSDLEGITEAAKHLEWRVGDLHAALVLARQGMRLSHGAQRAAFAHRVARLRRKLRHSRR